MGRVTSQPHAAVTSRRLVPLDGFATDLRYAAQGVPGVPERAWLEAEAADRLALAQDWLVRRGEGW